MAPDAPSWPSHAHVEKVRAMVVDLAMCSIDDVYTAMSPYRVCPIGAHTDHQGGTVTCMAINRGVLLGFAASGDLKVKVVSGQYNGTVEFSLDQLSQTRQSKSGFRGLAGAEEDANASGESRWGDYARGAATILQQSGYVLSQGVVGYLEGSQGFDGGGLSSSAAVGIAFLLALEYVNNLLVTDEENIELDRQIENKYLGLQSGILDQSAILLSHRHCLTVIDCKTRKHKIMKPPLHWRSTTSCKGGEYKILIAFSGLRHALVNKPGYNTRVMECQEAARILLKAVGRESSEHRLCNVSQQEYQTHKGKLGENLAKRAEHFFSENCRVFAGLEAWSSGDMEEFGRLMSESGQSSIDNYECGCEALVQLRQIILDAPGVFGARFSGAGFRGCCVGFVAAELAEEAVEYVQNHYQQAQPELVKQIVDTNIAVICESNYKAHVIY